MRTLLMLVTICTALQYSTNIHKSMIKLNRLKSMKISKEGNILYVVLCSKYTVSRFVTISYVLNKFNIKL